MSPKFHPSSIAPVGRNSGYCRIRSRKRLNRTDVRTPQGPCRTASYREGNTLRTMIRISIWLAFMGGLAGADEVSDWNQVMILATLTTPVTPAPVTTRVGAIVQAAVFDAVNGVDRSYTPIYVPAAAAPGTSQRAAAVQAAYATLANLYPDQKAKFDQQRTASMSAITDAPDAVQAGTSWGQYVADQ